MSDFTGDSGLQTPAPDCDSEFVLKILDYELLNILADWTNKKAATNPDIGRKYKGVTQIHSWQWTDVTADEMRYKIMFLQII